MGTSGPWRVVFYLVVVTLCWSINEVECTLHDDTYCPEYMEPEAVATMKEVVMHTPLIMSASRQTATDSGAVRRNVTTTRSSSVNATNGNNTQNTTVNSCLGDIAVTSRVANTIKNDMEKKSRTRRSIFDFEAFPTFKWELPIPYKIDSSFSAGQKQDIQKALLDWTSVTCVTFTELGATETRPHFVEFKPGRGCISFVGRVANQPQPVLLEASCFSRSQLTITHEVGHVLGFWHTQQQPGRDAHITVLRENIADGEEGSFMVLPEQLVVSTNVTGYDHASIMHYDSQDLSRDNRRVLGTVDSLYQNTIGQRVRVSFLDAKTINNAYCADKCTGVTLPKPCQNGGYQNPLDCVTCICPDGWSGDQCQNLAKSRGDTCGGELVATSQKQVVSSPRHSLGGPYPVQQQCTWRIKTSTSSKIKFRFVGKFGMYCTPFAFTCHDWVEIRFRQIDQVVGPRFCCESPPRDTFIAERDEVLLNLRVYSDSSAFSGRRLGFSIEYFVDAVRCDPNPCKNGGSCLTEGSALCQCTEGFTGNTCEQPIPQPCDSSPCQNGGTCNVGDNGNIICTCPNGYSGNLCQTAPPGPCDDNPCRNGGTCMVSGQIAFCVCPRGYRGPRCQVDAVRCDPNPCKNGGSCLTEGSALCQCTEGFTGNTCEQPIPQPCDSSPCQNGGTCNVGDNGNIICTCPNGYSGNLCQTAPPGPCDDNPCRNGGTCMVSGRIAFCVCPRGYRGPRCQVGGNACSSSPCLNGGTCRVWGRSFSCTCANGYGGRTCNTRASCNPNPCLNSGTCVQFRDGTRCLCPQGRGGATCEEVTNACHSSPCTGREICMPLSDSRYRCVCPTARGCDTVPEPTPCSSNPCGNRGQCVSRNGSFTCTCHRGFTGTTCENSNMCNPNPCKNCGTCQVRGATYQCTCPPGLSGRQCERGSCGACGESAGATCEPCMRYRTKMSTCSHTISYVTYTSFLFIFRKRVTRTRRVYRSCPIQTPMWETATCCDNAKLITDSAGAKKCVVEGWRPFGPCDGLCGGCGHSSRRGYTVTRDHRGGSLLTARLETRVCNTAVCKSCSWSDWLACRCDTPCCNGFRRVGNQCVSTRAP